METAVSQYYLRYTFFLNYLYLEKNKTSLKDLSLHIGNGRYHMLWTNYGLTYCIWAVFFISPPVIMSKVHEVTKSDSKMLCILRIVGEHILWFKINEVLLKGNFYIFLFKKGNIKKERNVVFQTFSPCWIKTHFIY